MMRKTLYLAVIIVALLPFEFSEALLCPKNCHGCNSRTGSCISCSGNKWWNPRCDFRCPTHCSDGQCDFKTGKCETCSQDQWWGEWCVSPCSKHCTDGKCDMKTAICETCSQDQWWGQRCGSPCPEHCTDGKCDKETGLCKTCSQDEWWGEKCLNQCPKHCTDGKCDMKTGLCETCSEDQWWGPTCGKKCPEHCSDGCDKETGCCKSCADGWAGLCTCSISPECANPEGKDCAWYYNCLVPHTPGCPVVRDIMAAKCREYYALESSLSPLGVQWSKYVRSCLQKKLAIEALIPAPYGRADCKKVTDIFFGKHVGCYLDGPISLCHLPFGDISKIIWHGKSILATSHWSDPIVTGQQLVAACGKPFWEKFNSEMARSAFTFPLP